MIRDSVTGSTKEGQFSVRRRDGPDMPAGGGGKKEAPKSAANAQHKSQNRRQQQTENLLTLISSATSAAHSFLSQNDLLLLPSQTLMLESLLASTSASLSSLVSPFPETPVTLPCPALPPPLHQQCWFHRFVVASGDDCDSRWRHVFGMSRPSFDDLLGLLSSGLDSALPSIPPNFALASALYRLAHGAPYKAVGRRFGLDSADACRAFYTVCKLVNEKLGHLFEFRSDVERILAGFRWISLPNCCGVLGFGRFGIEGELLGKNGSVMVQALVDSEGRFLDISAGWPSTLKPETILHQTKLYLEVEESSQLLNGPPHEIWNGNSIPQYVLGDPCFPLLPWLLTPYAKRTDEDSLSFSKTEFNSAHSTGMRLVSSAFAGVRARWQLLSRQWKEESLEFLPSVIVTGCLLHNFLLESNEPLPDEDFGYDSEEEELPPYKGAMDESGLRIRDALALHLAKVSLRR